MDNELKKIIDDIENNRIKGLDSLFSRASEKIASILNKSLNKEEITEKAVSYTHLTLPTKRIV